MGFSYLKGSIERSQLAIDGRLLTKNTSKVALLLDIIVHQILGYVCEESKGIGDGIVVRRRAIWVGSRGSQVSDDGVAEALECSGDTLNWFR